MANQGNHGRDKGGKPTWEDVGKGLEWLEREYGGHAECSIDVEGTRGGSGAFWVYVKLYAQWGYYSEPPKHVARSLWPCNQHRELASLVFKLIHSVDHMADAQRSAEQRGLPF
jgi:hypothetical protein